MTTDETTDERAATARLYVVTLLLIALAAGIWVGYVHDKKVVGGPLDLPLWVLVLAYAATELLTVHIEARGEAHALTFSEIPTIAGLLLADPGTVLVARVISGVAILGLVRRQSIHKLNFNLALFATEATVASAVLFALLRGDNPVSVGNWPAIFVALVASTSVSTAAVTAAITVYSGWPGRTMVTQVLIYGLLFCLANTATGITLISSIWERSYSGLLVVGVIAALFALYRAHLALSQRHKNLETLHQFTRSLGGSLELYELERAVVEGASESLRGEQAALLLPPIREGAPATRVLVTGGDVHRSHISPTELAADLAILLPAGESRLYEPGQPLPGWLAEIGVKDAAIVPLTDSGTGAGALLVANRLTEVSEFVEDDLRVFETLANHANVALENGRLVAHLQHEAQEQAYLALHDPVTGLPNRPSLTTQLEKAIQRAKDSELAVALLFIDLDTFKEVTDTLGTTTADRLLLEVRQRLQSLLPPTAVLARLAGDQFAVLVSGVTANESVLELADTIHGEFDTPFTADAVSLALRASVGIAFYPDHAPSAELLLQRADAATSMARADGSGMEVYAAESDPYAPRRLALAAELRESLAQGEVDVYVQPKVSLADGVVLGAEALVRWTHPRQGPLRPDQFIPAAEHTGVIRALTLYVVRDALAQCRSWRDAGLDLGISVNLSARNLFDTHLVEDIGAAIADAGVPASVLTLELTESTVMGESRRSMAVLEGLHGLGVGLSVDDFGTGYSSLSHLRQLPVTELKVDKSFVATMTADEHDAVIVRALVDLGRSLGLHTVAEGVESTEAWDLLRDLGCEQAQGYLLSRPLPAEQFVKWLERQKVNRIDHGDEVILFNRERRAASEDR